MTDQYDLKIPENKKPEEFTTLDNYIVIPILELENINNSLLRFYKKNNIEIKFRLHSKSEYEFSGNIIEMHGGEEEWKEEEEEEKKEEELRKESKESNDLATNVGYIPPPKVHFKGYHIILKDNKDNKIKLFLSDIDHRTIMPKAIQAIKPLFIFERENIPPKLRFEILEKYSHTCQYCGKKPPEVILEVDHIIPISKGGLTQADNLTISCRDCNIGKSDKILNQLREN